MRSAVRTGFLSLMGLLAAVDALAVEASFRDIARGLTPDISSLTSCSDQGGAGGYRTVVFSQGFEHVSSEVYLQRIEWDADGPRVLDSVPVAELSSGLWSVAEPVVLSRRRCAMQLTATHTYSAEVVRFILQPTGPGRYAIRRVGRK